MKEVTVYDSEENLIAQVFVDGNDEKEIKGIAKDGYSVIVDGDILYHEGNKEMMQNIEISQKENTTTANSDVKCYGTSENPMTEAEWNEYRKNNESVPCPDC